MRGIVLMLMSILDFAVLMYDRNMTGNFVLIDAFFDPVS